VREPRTIEGARALLFDRLVDLDPRQAVEQHPLRVLDRDGLRESVRREVARLLNTRTPLPPSGLEGRERTVLEYGLPDFSARYTRDPGARAELAREMERCIEAYEPRLRGVRVEVELPPGSQRELTARVSGTMVSGDVVEPVSFPVAVERDPRGEGTR